MRNPPGGGQGRLIGPRSRPSGSLKGFRGNYGYDISCSQRESKMTRTPQRRWIVAPLLEPAPIINTTPLIDLLLVLLVMLILSVPVSTHKMPLDLPGPPPPYPPAPPPAHRLDIDASGRLFWDGSSIADARLLARLAGMRADPRRPALHFAADGETRYERVDQVLALVLRAGITRLGLVGNDRFARTLDRPGG